MKKSVSAAERKRIWNRVRRAIKSGRIIKPNQCSKCKAILPKEMIEGHHFDYEKELEVIRVCQTCHANIHNRERFKPKKKKLTQTPKKKKTNVNDLIKRWC